MSADAGANVSITARQNRLPFSRSHRGTVGMAALGIRPDSTLETLAVVVPSFRTDGTTTAGNASLLNDGPSALLLGSQAAGAAIGCGPIARVTGRDAFALVLENVSGS